MVNVIVVVIHFLLPLQSELVVVDRAGLSVSDEVTQAGRGRVSLFDRLTRDRGMFCDGGASKSGGPVETGWGMISLSVKGSFSSAVITCGVLVGSGSGWGVVGAGRWASSCGVCRSICGGSSSSSLDLLGPDLLWGSDWATDEW